MSARRAPPALLLALACAVLGCDRLGVRRVAAEAGLDAAPLDAAPPADATAHARCTEGPRTSLADLALPGTDFEVGGAARLGDGVLLGVSRATGRDRVASVVRLGAGAPPRAIDLGVLTGDDPPPRTFARGAEAYAAAYLADRGDGGAAAKREGGRGRRLTVVRVLDAPEARATLPQASDESPAFDVIAAPEGSPSGAIVVWDEVVPGSDAGAAPRGVIRAALLSEDLRSVVQVSTVSPDIADAERPRVALRDGGFWVAWVARRREPRSADAAPELEAPGEEPAYLWIEVLALDEHARPAGAVRRISPATGHAAGFDLLGAGPRLEAAVILDDETTDGAGGQVLFVSTPPEGTPRATVVRAAGAARGATPWIGRTAGKAWLAFADTAERTHLVSLDDGDPSSGVDSQEPSLDEARVVAIAGPAGPGADLFAVSPGARGAALRLSCAP